MPDIYVTLEAAAKYEGLDYYTFQKRVKRNPKAYKTKNEPREDGGKDMVMVSVTSLSAKARRAYRAKQKVDGRDTVIEQRTAETRPWYVDVDYNYYHENNKKRYYEAVERASRLQDYIDYDGPDRTGYAEQLALSLGMSTPTLYRQVKNVLEANAWALKLAQGDGQNRDYFRVLALCRKPKETATFPSLTDEQKALIENIWFDKEFANNHCSKELLYEAFAAESKRRGWPGYPSYKTVLRYVNHLMELPGAESARYWAANGLREWKNARQVKGKRDASTLDVMEYVVADAHTFDIWVSYTAPNGKVKAIRPVLVAWMDMRSRRLLGVVLCEHSNAQVVKESFVKMVYEAGCAPKHVHMDNGKDFTPKELLGQDRKQREMDTAALMDAVFKGFYLAMGAKDWSRSKPFQPWDKPIERQFRTFCLRFSPKFKSYTGTLTSSKTEDKRHKDIKRMLERGELLTMDEFYDILQRFLAEDYDQRVHRGLKDFGEAIPTPGAVWSDAPRCDRAAPPREYAAMLLMKPATARVTNQGITKFKTLYTATELGLYVNQMVGIRWDVDDVRKLYVYDKNGKKICEAYAAELLQFGDRVPQESLEALHSKQNHNQREIKRIYDEFNTPHEQRINPDAPAVVGKVDLMIGHKPTEKVIALPVDKEFSGEMAAKKRSTDGDEFLNKKAEEALARLRAIGD
ncbi:MAG: Mu transposase C-terminal domain-containing protein [Oscillospiraceae bacterium]|nr:Mu transposase C-terminal domain-containing protein [Oscillospiraceae bacterium]